METRLDNNRKILEIVDSIINAYPTLRFVQILWILDIINEEDRFHEEPSETLKRVTKALNDSNLLCLKKNS